MAPSAHLFASFNLGAKMNLKHCKEFRSAIMKAQTIGLLLASCGIFAVPLAARAQQQDQSLAEKARQIREKEKAARKPNVVWTNANLPTDAALSIVGQVSSSTQSSTQEPAATGQNEKPADASEMESELAKLKS